MSDQKPTLDYAPPSGPKQWPTWVVFGLMALWPFVTLCIWWTAFISLVFTALAIVNLFHAVPGPWMYDKPASHLTNALWITRYASLAVIFVPLAIWHWRWKRRNSTRKK